MAPTPADDDHAHDASPTLETLLRLEHAVWQAFADGDPASDGALLHEQFLGVSATGFLDRAAHLAQLQAGPVVSHYEIAQARLLVLQPDLVILAYRAECTWSARPGAKARMYISSLWRRSAAGWLNVFSQDTPAA
jgi:hypothetical protein